MSATARARHRRVPEAPDGVAGNERLTALTGAVLLIGFAAGGITIVSVSRLLTLHVFLGMLLIGPVAVKIGSTCYRFARYYTGAPPYVEKGPAAPLLSYVWRLPRVLLYSPAGRLQMKTGGDWARWLLVGG